MKLRECPCGKTPTSIEIYDENQGGKWAWAVPDCCNEWNIEFRTHYNALNSDACKVLAEEAWNDSPRGYSKEITELIEAVEYLVTPTSEQNFDDRLWGVREAFKAIKEE